jgi:hypothetical protein
MKIVVNRCYGGFGISKEALLELIKRDSECVGKFTPKKYYGGENRNTKWEENFNKDLKNHYIIDLGDGYLGHRLYTNIYKDGIIYTDATKDHRTDHDLIELIEIMGDAVNSEFSELKVIEIPDGIEYEIEDYYGIETIHEIHRSWG